MANKFSLIGHIEHTSPRYGLLFTDIDHKARNSAIADKPRDAFVQYAMAWMSLTMTLHNRTCDSMPTSIFLGQTARASLEQGYKTE